MNKKIFTLALVLVSITSFFSCSSGDSHTYEGKFCFWQVFNGEKQIGYFCESIGSSIAGGNIDVTEEFCNDDNDYFRNRKIVYTCTVWCYSKKYAHPLCQEIGTGTGKVTQEACFDDLIDGQVVDVCPK